MSRMIFTRLFVALALNTNAASAQTQGTTTTEARMGQNVVPRRHLNGPRFGFTVFTGDVADHRPTWSPS